MAVLNDGPSWAADVVATPSGIPKNRSERQTWDSLGVDPSLARALATRGFKIPTPIQRSTIPHSLVKPHRDVLGMARTGSGKTLAYMIPLLQRLCHQEINGIRNPRALILCPNRELALQILKVGKDLARNGLRSGAGGKARLRWALVIGGDPMDKQFEDITSGPDVIVATPGRFLHLVIEMAMNLRSIEIVVYDEADRLFEMGFDPQLREILIRLPSLRQSLLFSATLPTSVADFAKAGLQNPVLIRLDAEVKVSPNLRMAFFPTKPAEKDAALLVLLDRVLGIRVDGNGQSGDNQAIVFVATRHHVEYVTTLLTSAGYRAAHIYGSLDQVARQGQMESFRAGETSLLIVTDVAARGLDIPVMENVINYDFPDSTRLFVHRVGRTARAGRKGAAWSFIKPDDMPYLSDLEDFLGTRIIGEDSTSFALLPQDSIDEKVEYIFASLGETNAPLAMLRQVMQRGQAMHDRTRRKATHQAYRRAKAYARATKARDTGIPTHPAFLGEERLDASTAHVHLLASIQAYTPHETIFEIGTRGRTQKALLMKARRQSLARRPVQPHVAHKEDAHLRPKLVPVRELKSFRDADFCLGHAPEGAFDRKAYSLQDEGSFPQRIRAVTHDLPTDSGESQRLQKPSQLKWNRKTKRFSKDEVVGTDNKKLLRSESGALLPPTYSSGRFKSWQVRTRTPSSLVESDRQSQTTIHSGGHRKRLTLSSTRRTAKGEWKDAHRRSPKTVGASSHASAGLLSADGIRKRKLQYKQRRDKNGRPTP